MVAVLDELLDLDPSLNPIITRVYVGPSKGAAALKYSEEASVLSKIGYVAASDRWETRHEGARAQEPEAGEGTLWVTYVAKSLKSVRTVCSFCGSELPA